MIKYFSKPTIYVSHPILGTTGDMEGNCKIAIKAIKKLRKIFPEVDFFLPADSDLVLQILYNANKLSVEDILWADLKILDACHGWFFYRFDESSGSKIEHKEAILIGLIEGTENDIVWDISKASYGVLRKRFTGIVEQAKKRFLGE